MTGTAVGDWLDQLDEYGVEFIILDLDGDCELVEVFRLQTSWIVDFEDGEAVIFARTPPSRMN